VPHASFWRSFARATEAATEGEVVYKETKDILDALSNSIPFGDKIGNPPVKIDVFGEPVIIEGGVLRQWLPFKWQKETDDVVEIELDRLGVYPGLPSNKFKDGKVEYEMTQKEYQDYAIKTGQTIKKVLDKLMLNEKYKKLDDDSKLIAINKSIDTIRPLIRNTIKEIIKARRSQSP